MQPHPTDITLLFTFFQFTCFQKYFIGFELRTRKSLKCKMACLIKQKQILVTNENNIFQKPVSEIKLNTSSVI